MDPHPFRREDWFVRPIPHARAAKFIQAFHYARGGSKTGTHTFGLFHVAGGDWLAGVTWWLPPTRVAAESVDRDQWRRVLSLTRMAIFPLMPRNACSFLLARSVQAIRAEKRWSALVTYADESQGHTGAVYRAAGWQYVGRTGPTPRWVDPRTGRQVSPKATTNRTKDEMQRLGYVMTGRFHKHKFVLRLR